MELTTIELTRLWKNGKTFTHTALSEFSKGACFENGTGQFSDNDTAALRELRSALHDGRYIGIGFPEPKRHGDVPLQIPSDAWAPDVSDWQLEIGPGVLGLWSYAGLDFCEVRVVQSATHLTKSGGRPTLKNILEGAIERLSMEGLVDIAKDQNEHFDPIRNNAIHLYPSHKAQIQKASERTISKYFSPIYNDLKDASE